MTITVKPGRSSREVRVPYDVAEALRGRRGSRTAFDGLTDNQRRELLREKAKGVERRARRIEKGVDLLLERAAGKRKTA